MYANALRTCLASPYGHLDRRAKSACVPLALLRNGRDYSNRRVLQCPDDHRPPMNEKEFAAADLTGKISEVKAGL